MAGFPPLPGVPLPRPTSTVLRIFEEVLVYLFEHEGLFNNHAAVVLDHERGKLGAIDEHEAGVHALRIVNGLGAVDGTW